MAWGHWAHWAHWALLLLGVGVVEGPAAWEAAWWPEARGGTS